MCATLNVVLRRTDSAASLPEVRPQLRHALALRPEPVTCPGETQPPYLSSWGGHPWAPGGFSVLTNEGLGQRGELPRNATLLLVFSVPVWASEPGPVMALRVPGAARAAYLLGIASEHRVDQLDPVRQAGGDDVAWAVGRGGPLAQVACSAPRGLAGRQPGRPNGTQCRVCSNSGNG